MPWGNLRPGLLADLGFTAAADLAQTIHYADVASMQRALDGTEPPPDELMSALLRHYLTVPALYFVTTEPSAA
jgi:hypothetical protein